MPLVKAQCTNCGGTLEVDNSKDAAICPYCNTPYIVDQAINKFNVSNANINIQGANINVSGHLDADTMFENWLVTKDERLKNDFLYYYATDPRKEYFTIWTDNGFLNPNIDPDKAEEIINRCLIGPRYASYRDEMLAKISKMRKTKKQDRIILAVIIAVLVALSIAALLGYQIL